MEFRVCFSFNYYQHFFCFVLFCFFFFIKTRVKWLSHCIYLRARAFCFSFFIIFIVCSGFCFKFLLFLVDLRLPYQNFKIIMEFREFIYRLVCYFPFIRLPQLQSECTCESKLDKQAAKLAVCPEFCVLFISIHYHSPIRWRRDLRACECESSYVRSTFIQHFLSPWT